MGCNVLLVGFVDQQGMDASLHLGFGKAHVFLEVKTCTVTVDTWYDCALDSNLEKHFSTQQNHFSFSLCKSGVRHPPWHSTTHDVS